MGTIVLIGSVRIRGRQLYFLLRAFAGQMWPAGCTLHLHGEESVCVTTYDALGFVMYSVRCLIGLLWADIKAITITE